MNYTDVYKKFNKISINNYKSFLNAINDQWNNIKNPEYIIDNNCKAYRFEELNDEALHDRFDVIYNGIKFDCLLTGRREKHKDLFVIFSGSRNLSDKLPIFKRWSYYPFINCMVLSIADPMFYKYENLLLGWYYGTKEENYIEYVSKIIQKILNILNIDEKNLYLFGSSGGGYVSLQLSMYFNNTNHIVINPQITIQKYPYAKFFSQITGISFSEKDIYKRDNTIDIILEGKRKNNKFFIIQNIQDPHDCQYQLFPLCQKIGINSLNLGINHYGNILIWLYSAFGGHNAQGDQFIFSHILDIYKKFNQNDFKISADDDMLYKNIACIWRQLSWYEYDSKELRKKLNNKDSNLN